MRLRFDDLLTKHSKASSGVSAHIAGSGNGVEGIQDLSYEGLLIQTPWHFRKGQAT